MPILRLSGAKILFYCHFPDLLLSQRSSLLKRLYRFPLDKLEEFTTGMAHLVLVNSEFTRGIYQETFTSLQGQVPPEVLYPCVTIESRDKLCQAAGSLDPSLEELPEGALVSINRFERKKNVALALEAYIELQQRSPSVSRRKAESLPRLVFAGGFDPNNLENKEYLDELAGRVKASGLRYCLVLPPKLEPLIDQEVLAGASSRGEAHVWFVPSFSNAQRSTLLEKSLAIIYTPMNEHFGIVPIEAMGACRPVVTCNTGGPLESVIHAKTGYHCQPKPGEWADAFEKLMAMDPKARDKMREECYQRAQRFGIESFGDELDRLCQGLLDEEKKSR